MPSKEAVAPATEFSAQEIAALRERRDAVEAEWIETAREQMSEDADDKARLVAEVSPEAQEKIARLEREWLSLGSTLKLQEDAKEQAAFVKAEEDLTARAPSYRDRLAKANAKLFKDMIAVGRNEYRNPNPNAEKGITPGSVDLGLPLISRNPHTGMNEVHPFPAVFAERGDQWEANLEASFRNAEMIHADKWGDYDPVTGNRKGRNAQLSRREKVEADQDLSDYTQLTQGGMLHLYEIQMNELARYMDIKQTPFINNFLVDRRTTVPNAGLVDEAAPIATTDSGFDTVTVSPSKFATIKGMSFESAMTQEPWSMQNTLMMDGGIALGNGVGFQIVRGDGSGTGMAQQFTGLDAWGNAAATNRRNLHTANSFLTTTGNDFGITEMSQFIGRALPKEYFRKPGKKLVMPLATWAGLMGVEDSDGRRLFLTVSNNDIGDMKLMDYGTEVVLDENVDGATATLAAGDNAWFYGDLMSFCLVYFGSVRVDFSPHVAWTTDQLRWRFIGHRGFENIDANGFRAGRLT